MHELGIVFQIIRSVEKTACENFVKNVRSVTIELGQVSGVVHTQLESCWKWAADRTELLAGADLIIDEIPAVTYCEKCGKIYDTVRHGELCPYCGSEKTFLQQGNEMNIREIMVE